ncbi:MAG: (d)CMP kinase [Gemmatimonadales bacterium]
MTLRVIAIDGPAASGKSSTGALVAARLGWAHLDSGALYRAVTLAVLDTVQNRDTLDTRAVTPQRILAAAESLPVRLVLVGDEFRPEIAGVDVADAIRSERVTRQVSAVAAIPQVRTWANAQQRQVVDAVEVGGGRGVVVDGRDIGTVVFPDAPLKIYLVATPEERARRRLTQRGETLDEEAVRRESAALAARDGADSTRPVAPLKPAADAVLLDSTALTLEAQVVRVVELARRVFPG